MEAETRRKLCVTVTSSFEKRSKLFLTVLVFFFGDALLNQSTHHFGLALGLRLGLEVVEETEKKNTGTATTAVAAQRPRDRRRDELLAAGGPRPQGSSNELSRSEVSTIYSRSEVSSNQFWNHDDPAVATSSELDDAHKNRPDHKQKHHRQSLLALARRKSRKRLHKKETRERVTRARTAGASKFFSKETPAKSLLARFSGDVLAGVDEDHDLLLPAPAPLPPPVIALLQQTSKSNSKSTTHQQELQQLQKERADPAPAATPPAATPAAGTPAGAPAPAKGKVQHITAEDCLKDPRCVKAKGGREAVLKLTSTSSTTSAYPCGIKLTPEEEKVATATPNISYAESMKRDKLIKFILIWGGGGFGALLLLCCICCCCCCDDDDEAAKNKRMGINSMNFLDEGGFSSDGSSSMSSSEAGSSFLSGGDGGGYDQQGYGAGQAGGYYDEYGNWIPDNYVYGNGYAGGGGGYYDENGNWIDPGGAYGGADGNYNNNDPNQYNDNNQSQYNSQQPKSNNPHPRGAAGARQKGQHEERERGWFSGVYNWIMGDDENESGKPPGSTSEAARGRSRRRRGGRDSRSMSSSQLDSDMRSDLGSRSGNSRHSRRAGRSRGSRRKPAEEQGWWEWLFGGEEGDELRSSEIDSQLTSSMIASEYLTPEEQKQRKINNAYKDMRRNRAKARAVGHNAALGYNPLGQKMHEYSTDGMGDSAIVRSGPPVSRPGGPGSRNPTTGLDAAEKKRRRAARLARGRRKEAGLDSEGTGSSAGSVFDPPVPRSSRSGIMSGVPPRSASSQSERAPAQARLKDTGYGGAEASTGLQTGEGGGRPSHFLIGIRGASRGVSRGTEGLSSQMMRESTQSSRRETSQVASSAPMSSRKGGGSTASGI